MADAGTLLKKQIAAVVHKRGDEKTKALNLMEAEHSRCIVQAGEAT